MRRAAVVLAVPALVASMLMGSAALASAESSKAGVTQLLLPPRCC